MPVYIDGRLQGGDGGGVTGPTGPRGPVGGWTIEYQFSTDTSAPPGSGYVKLDNASPASVTNVYVSDTDRFGTDVNLTLNQINPGDFIRVFRTDGTYAAATYLVTSAVDSGVYQTYGVTFLSSTGSFVNDGNIGFSFAPEGIQGPTGPDGATGPPGVTGPDGATGPSGADGAGVAYYGEISVAGNASGQTLTNQNEFYKITQFDTNGISNGMVNDQANNKITVNNAGVYEFLFTFSFSGSTTRNFIIGIYIDGVLATQAQAERKLGSGGDVGAVPISCIASVGAGEDVELYVKCTDVAGATFLMTHGNFNVRSIGGNGATGPAGAVGVTGPSGPRDLISWDVNQAAHGLAAKDAVYVNGSGNYVKGKADAAATLAMGVVSAVAGVDDFTFAQVGRFTNAAHGWAVGATYYLSNATAGLLTDAEPVSGFSQPMVTVLDANTLMVVPYRPSAL
jgi:hypothetical protein